MYEVGVYSGLFEVGLTEDGESAVSELYFVIVQAQDGTRWRHNATFLGSEMVVVEDMVYYPDNREVARKKARELSEKVEAHLLAGGAINFDHWTEIDPAYGSAAYQALDDFGYFKEREKNEEFH